MFPKVSEFDVICRTCLAKGSEKEPFYGDISQDVDLFQMLETCTSLPLTKEDLLPSHICYGCFGALKKAFEFRQRCELSETTLRAILRQSFEDYMDSLKSGDESSHSEEDMMPVEDVKLERDDEGKEVSMLLNHLPSLHVVVEPTGLADRVNCNSISENNFQVPEIQEKPEEITCSVCMKKMAYRNFKRHMLLHNPKKAFKCSFCEKSYSRKDALAQHQLAHNKSEDDIKRTTCELCGKVLSTTASLKSHMRQHNGVREFMCTVCGKLFFTNTARAVHEKVHSDQKPYECEVCGKGFKQKHNIGTHMRSHTGEKPFECTECGQKCFTSSHLKLHMRIHTGERPYECKICLKTFSYLGSFKVHKKSHTGIFEHFCSFCNKGFYQLSDLKNHIRMHTGEKPYPCKICGKTFSQSTYRSIHMKNVHRKKAKMEPAKEDESDLT